jgi:hypothetical protein
LNDCEGEEYGYQNGAILGHFGEREGTINLIEIRGCMLYISAQQAKPTKHIWGKYCFFLM